MFTHKQLWRREGIGIVRGPRKDFLYEEVADISSCFSTLLLDQIDFLGLFVVSVVLKE
jgi:hypothetical protein